MQPARPLAAGLASVASGVSLSFNATEKVVVPGLHSFFHVEGTSTSIVKDRHGNPHQLLLLETSRQVRSEDLAKSLALYALPADNPARRAERQSARHDTPDNDPAADATATDDDRSDDDRGHPAFTGFDLAHERLGAIEPSCCLVLREVRC